MNPVNKRLFGSEELDSDDIDDLNTVERVNNLVQITGCEGYTAGVLETVDAAKFLHPRLIKNQEDSFKRTYGEKSLPFFCIPEGVTREQLIRVGVKYMEENPAGLHLKASYLLFYAFLEAFPLGDCLDLN